MARSAIEKSGELVAVALTVSVQLRKGQQIRTLIDDLILP